MPPIQLVQAPLQATVQQKHIDLNTTLSLKAVEIENIKEQRSEEREVKQAYRAGMCVLPGTVKLLRRPELEQEHSQGDIWCFGWQGDSESLYVDQNDSDRRFVEILP